MTTKRITDLDALSGVAGRIKLFGEEHEVVEIDGYDYRLLADGLDGIPALRLYELAGKLVPSLGERVNELKGSQVGAIIGIATGAVQSVEEQFPNADGPAASTTAPASP